MKRIMGMLCFQNMDDAARAMDALEDAGYEFNIRHDAVDIYGAAVFMKPGATLHPTPTSGRQSQRYTTNSAILLIPSTESQMMSASSRKASHMTSAP
jgi:hypothetical protein